MKYNFSKPIDRSGTSAVKFDMRNAIFGRSDVIPMWVADMDFETPPFIVERMKMRLEHPIFGYTIIDDEFKESIEWWLKKRFEWEIEKRWISFCPGIVAGLNHAVQAFTEPNDKILIQTPVYHPFFYAVRQNNRELLTNPLKINGHRYEIDFDHLEKQLALGVKMFILCNPHNPVGRVWERQELEKIASLCIKYNVILISDEIHADLVFKPNKHISIATLSDEIASRTVTFCSASKTFNIAGLTTAYVVIKNEKFLKRYNQQLNMNGTNHGNVFGYEALKAAYTPQGEVWLEQLLEYLWDSVEFTQKFLEENIPQVKLVEPEGTYLLWLDFRNFGLSVKELNEKLVHEAGVGFNAGEIFGVEGEGFQRMNIGCPRAVVEETLIRTKNVFASM